MPHLWRARCQGLWIRRAWLGGLWLPGYLLCICFLCRWNSIHEYGLGTFTMSGQTSNCGQKPAGMPFPSASSSFRNVLKLRGRHVVVPGRWTVPANILFISFISCWFLGSWTVRWLLHMCQASRNRVMSIYSNMWCNMVDHKLWFTTTLHISQ